MTTVVSTRRETRMLLGLFLLLFASSALAQVNVPLTVQEMDYPGQSGIARTSDPLTVGIPLARGAVACANANPASRMARSIGGSSYSTTFLVFVSESICSLLNRLAERAQIQF